MVNLTANQRVGSAQHGHGLGASLFPLNLRVPLPVHVQAHLYLYSSNLNCNMTSTLSDSIRMNTVLETLDLARNRCVGTAGVEGGVRASVCARNPAPMRGPLGGCPRYQSKYCL